MSSPTAPDSAAPADVPISVVCAAALAVIAGLVMAGTGIVGFVGQTRTLLFVVYVLIFALVVPGVAALAASPAVARLGAVALRAGALLGLGALAGLVLLLRLIDLAGAGDDAIHALALVGGTGVVLVTCGAAGLIAAGPQTPAWARRLAGLTESRLLPLVGGIAVLVVLVAFTPHEVAPLAAAASIAFAAGIGLLAARRRWAPIAGPYGRVLDVALLAVVALLVIDLGGYWGEDIAASDSQTPFFTTFSVSAQLHQHFFLGPINDVLHGRALLVDANSVYGIGNTYVLALLFKMVPLNYGTFTLIGSLMTLLMLMLGWWIARAAGVARPAAAVVVLVAVLISVLDPSFPPTIYSNLGGFRFGPPLALLAVALLSYQDGRSVSRSPWVIAVYAVASTWSLEALTYCSGAFLALVLVDVTRAASLRRAAAEAGRSLGAALIGCLIAHAVFALATLVVTGSLPDWTDYVALFRAWSDIISVAFGSYGLESWSRVLLVGGLYAASLVGVVLLTRAPGRHSVPGRTVVAIAGLSGTGIAFLSYFLAHSRDFYLLYISLPALILCAIWLTLAARPGATPLRRGVATAVGSLLALLLVAGGWDEGRDRFSTTALAHFLPGGPSLADDLEHLWDGPPINPSAPAAEQLLDEYFPEDEAIVLTEPDLGQEALLRSGRANGLPISYPWQDEVYLERSLPPVEAAVDRLEAGTRLLLQEPPSPDAPPTAQQAFGNVPIGERLGPLAQAALDRIKAEWKLKRIAEGPDGLYVAELAGSR